METQKLLKQVESLIAARNRNPRWLDEICALLQSARSHYNWVGVYFLEGRELVLGPFAGASTPHTRIPLEKGICGLAAREMKTVIVPDVSADPHYLACTAGTRSEIVVPIEAEGRILAEIDIDSHTHNAFRADDHQLLEQIAQRLAPVLMPVPNRV
jgi:GAF domain-containing protein